MSEVRVLEISLPRLPAYLPSNTIKTLCATGYMDKQTLFFMYEGGCYVVRATSIAGSSWFGGWTTPAPAGAEAYGLTLWELSK